MSHLCLNLIELPDIETIAALENFKEIAEDKIEPLTKCHNSIIGHGGTDRTLSNLLGSLVSCPRGLYGPEVRFWRTKSEDSIAE
jgi:hypothetical protein